MMWLTSLLAIAKRAAPKPSDRRALASGAVVIGSTLLLGSAVPRWREWEAREADQTRASTEALERARREISRSKKAPRARLAASTPIFSDDSLIQSAASGSASAQLALILGDMADESGLRLLSVGIRPDTVVRRGATRIAVRVEALGDVEGVTDYLAHIEGSDRLLAIRELGIAQSEPAAAPTAVETLRLDVLVETIAIIRPKKPVPVAATARVATRSTQ